MSEHPSLDRALVVLGQWRNLVQAVEGLIELHQAEYLSTAEHHLSKLEAVTGPEGFEEAVYGYMEMTIETLRMQAEFYRSGVFSAEESEFESGLHADEDLMLGRYLPGLYIAQVFWPNHYDKHRFFEQSHLPLIANGSTVLDVGTGPGSFGLAARARTSKVLLNDLSEHSRTFVETLCQGAPDLSCDFMVQSYLDLNPRHYSFDHIIFSEVVEHLPDPERGMSLLSELLAPDGLVFFSTATNAAFYDHTIIFDDIPEIRDLIDRHGFRVVELSEVLATPGPDGRDVVDVNAVLRKKSDS